MTKWYCKHCSRVITLLDSRSTPPAQCPGLKAGDGPCERDDSRVSPMTELAVRQSKRRPVQMGRRRKYK